MDNGCIFCKIVNDKVNLLYENDSLIVIRDINPQAPVHLLIIPKKHIRSINNLTFDDKDLLINIIMVAKEMALKERIHKSGYKIFFNVEKGGGQIIFHLHLHLLGGWDTHKE